MIDNLLGIKVKVSTKWFRLNKKKRFLLFRKRKVKMINSNDKNDIRIVMEEKALKVVKVNQGMMNKKKNQTEIKQFGN